MEHTKKFYFVPADMLAKLNEKFENSKQISSNLEKDVVDTIVKKGSKVKQMPADRRAILYSQYLQKYLAHKNKLSSPLSPIVKVSEPDKNKNITEAVSSDIEKIKNDIYNLQSVFTEKYNDLVGTLQEYWGKGVEQRHIDLPSASTFHHRSSTPLPKSAPATAIQSVDEDQSSSASEGTFISRRRSSLKPSTRHRKGRTKSIQKIIDDLPRKQLDELASKLHERITRSKGSTSEVVQGGKGFRINKWKTYYQHKV